MNGSTWIALVKHFKQIFIEITNLGNIKSTNNIDKFSYETERNIYKSGFSEACSTNIL